MKATSSIFILVIVLLQTSPTAACTCDVDWSFCETLTNSDNVVEVKIISKYGSPELEHMDIKLLENLQNGISIDSLSVSTNGLLCQFPLSGFNVGDTLIIAFNQFINPMGNENYSVIEFSACKRNFLIKILSEINGFITPTLSSQNYAEFKNNLTTCNDLIASNEDLELLENSIIISPNPFSENINIEFGNLPTSKISIELFSSDGQKTTSIKNLQQYNYKLPTSDSPKGIYFIKIQYRNESIVKKIVKI